MSTYLLGSDSVPLLSTFPQVGESPSSVEYLPSGRDSLPVVLISYPLGTDSVPLVLST